MDYRGFREGVTVDFPVFAEGGLFHLGDGHALQGDGEIVGTGIEVSMDVEFSLELLKGKTIRWPRADDGTFVMAVGNARPLDQALQHATTELLRLLEQDYGLELPRGLGAPRPVHPLRRRQRLRPRLHGRRQGREGAAGEAMSVA